MKIHFFIGKGGVGKSTVASLSALNLAQNGHKTLLSSLDPAHNLSDIFETKLNEKAYPIHKHLSIIEIDQKKWIKHYLQESVEKLSSAYNYLTATSMEHHFSIMKHAVGVEEYALILAYSQIKKQHSGKTYLLFDMPPTALSLKFFALPHISIIWLEKLKSLRLEIIKKEKIISAVQFGKKEWQRDRVLQNINNQLQFWNDLKNQLMNKELTTVHIIENNEALSQAEAKRIANELQAMKIENISRITNKGLSKNGNNNRFTIPILKESVGLKKLTKQLEKIDIKQHLKLFT